MEYLLLIAVGLFAGIIGSLVGLGGGIIVVPALVNIALYTPFLNDVTPQIAVGTSMVTTIATAVSSTLLYRKRGTIDYRTGIALFVGAFPGSIIGANVNGLFDFESFGLFFGVFLILVSLLLMFQDSIPKAKKSWRGSVTRTMALQGENITYHFQPVIAALLSFFIGFIGSLFGIGGGSLMVPMMIILFAIPPHIAVATSMFSIMLSSTVSSATHIALGNVAWVYLLFLIPAAYAGAKIGSHLNMRLKSKTLVVVLRLILIILGIQMLIEAM
ncbi:MAG: sulfite exporter TauE/SafE family protein [Bacilli bacterium]